MAIPIPLTSQLPLIARPGTPYSFTFAPGSFSGSSQITYSEISLPAWATFDASTLTISGTPQETDVSATNVTINASGSGVNAQDTFVLLVSDQPAPSVGTSLSAQFDKSAVSGSNSISSAYAFTNPSVVPGLRIPPSWSFSIGLTPASFSSPTGASLFYSALQADGTPLPSWLAFYNTSLVFNGVTPSQDELVYPYEVDLELIASDVWGFSAAREKFKLVLSAWEMELSPYGGVNVTVGQNVQLALEQVFGSSVLLNGLPIGTGNLSSVALIDSTTSSLPSWLTFTPSPPTLSGTPPSSSSSTPIIIPVNITSTLPTPSLITNLTLSLFPSYFTADASSLPAIVSTQGDKLSYPLGAWLSNATMSNVQLNATFNPSNMSNWLTFTPSPVPTLSGTPPQNLGYAAGNVTLSALSPTSNTMSTTTISLLVSPPHSTSGMSNSTDSGGLSSSGRVALIVIGSIAAVLLACLCLFCCLRRRQRGQRVRKSQIGRAYVIDTNKVMGTPSTDKDEEKDVGFMSPTFTDEMGRLSDDGAAHPYVPHPKQLNSPIPRSGSNRSISPPPPAVQASGSKKEAWWTRMASGSLSSTARGSIKKWQISKPISRLSRHISSSVSPHPGMNVPTGRGILIRVPEPPRPAALAGENGQQSVRFVPPRSSPALAGNDSWTPPPSLAVPGSDSVAYGYDGYGYASPPPQPSDGRRGSNPFMHARDSGSYKRESFSGFASTADESVSGSGSGRSGEGLSSEGFGSGSLGHSGSAESERPVRRRDFAAPTAGRMGMVEEEEDEEEDETEVEGEEEVVISRAAVVKNGTPKRPRLVDFTSERTSDVQVKNVNRMSSHKALLSPPISTGPAFGSGFQYLSSASITGGQAGMVSPSVPGSAVIYDGSNDSFNRRR